MDDWFDAALRGLEHDARSRLLDEFGAFTGRYRVAGSWSMMESDAARRTVAALLGADVPAAWFWAHAAREFRDRADLGALTHPLGAR